MADRLPVDRTPSQIAAALGVSIRTVQRWIEGGSLPARRVGGRWRVASDAFDAFVAEQQGTAASGSALAPMPRPIHSVFVANRGEVAQRIQRTCDRLGIRVTIPRSDGDGSLDLLDRTAVVRAALASGADAVHPGFGFLAEDASFAAAVADAGLTWIGPPPAAMREMGDKAAARRRALSLGIAVPAGYDGAEQTDGAVTLAADAIGYPLLIKPAAGGGGKGMHSVERPAQLADALVSARREAKAAFGDDRLILERRVDGARHIEIQVLFDAAGNGVHLGERDCSLQRRHQKVLEESPSPALDGKAGQRLRQEMGEAALRIARSVGYVGAGTCEFLLDEAGQVTFLEMNTRLQVEHPVTELVTGRDLVADQLRIAAGAPLGFGQADVHAAGHAIEVRLYAEDAEAGFLPATGRVEALRWPTGEGIRVDAGIELGAEVGSRYDPMLAKILAHGRDRVGALARLTRALDETVVLGLVTNLRFLRWVLRQPIVREGGVRTDSLEALWPPEGGGVPAELPDAAWTTAAMLFLGETPALTVAGATALGAWTGGWRLNAAPTIRLTADGVTRSVVADGFTSRSVPPDAVVAGGAVHLDLDGRSLTFRVAAPPDADRAAERAQRAAGAGPAELSAPMPGRVLAIHAAVGAQVEAGVPIVTLEAMKMEHAVLAPMRGVVVDIDVSVDQQVQRGQRLATVSSTATMPAVPAVPTP